VDTFKPVRPERLANALQRVVYSQKPVEAERLSTEKILLDSDEEMRVVFVAEISVISARGTILVSSSLTVPPLSSDAESRDGTSCCQNPSSSG
jgi:hypothetical protein